MSAGPVFSRGDGLVFGSFHYPLGLVHFTYSPEIAEAISAISSGAPIGVGLDEEELIELAYGTTSMLHEMRHFYDQFGTFSGICLIATYLSCLKSFAHAVARVRADGGVWQWPVREWVKSSGCPQEVKDFYRRGSAFRLGAEAFVSPFNPVAVDGHLEPLFVDVPYLGGHEIVAAVLRVMSFRGKEQTPRTLLHPLGLESLFEGNAHAVSRSLIDQFFPPQVAQAFQQRIWTTEREKTTSDGAMPYMVLDLAISRFMRAHGVETFERNLVLALSDSALSQSPFVLRDFDAHTTAAEVHSPGHALRASLRESDVPAFTRGDVPPSSLHGEAYAGLLSQYEKGGDWDTVTDDNSLMASLMIWESYLAQNVVVPLLRARLTSDHRAFRTANGMTDLLGTIVPPIIVVGQELRIGKMPDRVQRAWWHQMMVGQIAMRILDDEPLLCPRAWATVPGLDLLSLTRPGEPSCNDYARLGCGTYRGHSQLVQPACLFQDTLRGCGFIS